MASLILFFKGLNFATIKNYALIALVILLVLVSLVLRQEKTAHALTTSKFDGFIAMQATIIAQSKAENAINAKNYQSRISLLEGEAIRRDIDRAKLKEQLNEKVNSNAILRNAMRVRNNKSTSQSGMSEIPINTEILTEAERTCNEAINTLIYSGASCHYDYTDLYNSWQAACDTYGCE